MGRGGVGEKSIQHGLNLPFEHGAETIRSRAGRCDVPGRRGLDAPDAGPGDGLLALRGGRRPARPVAGVPRPEAVVALARQTRRRGVRLGPRARYSRPGRTIREPRAPPTLTNSAGIRGGFLPRAVDEREPKSAASARVVLRARRCWPMLSGSTQWSVGDVGHRVAGSWRRDGDGLRSSDRDRSISFARRAQGIRGVGPVAGFHQGVGAGVEGRRASRLLSWIALHHNDFRRPRGAARISPSPARSAWSSPRAPSSVRTPCRQDISPPINLPHFSCCIRRRRPTRRCRSAPVPHLAASCCRDFHIWASNTVPRGWRPSRTERSPRWSAASASIRSATPIRRSWPCCLLLDLRAAWVGRRTPLESWPRHHQTQRWQFRAGEPTALRRDGIREHTNSANTGIRSGGRCAGCPPTRGLRKDNGRRPVS